MVDTRKFEKQLNKVINDFHNTLLNNTYIQLTEQLNSLNNHISQNIQNPNVIMQNNSQIQIGIINNSKINTKKPIKIRTDIADIYSILNLHPFPKCPECGKELEFYKYRTKEDKYHIECSCCDYSISHNSWKDVIKEFNNEALKICKDKYRKSGRNYILACLGINFIFGWVSFPILIGIYGFLKFLVGPKVIEYFFKQKIEELKQAYPYKTAIEKANITELEYDDNENINYKEFLDITNNITKNIKDYPINNVTKHFIQILTESNRIKSFMDSHIECKSQISYFLNYARLAEKTLNIYKNVLQYSSHDEQLIQQIGNSVEKLSLVYEELYKRLVNNAFDAERATLKVVDQLSDEILKKPF